MQTSCSCTEVPVDERSKERKKGTWGHGWTHTLDPVPLGSLLILCIAWVFGSDFTHSCSCHGGGENTLDLVLESHGDFSEGSGRSRRGGSQTWRRQRVRRQHRGGLPKRETETEMGWRCPGVNSYSLSKVEETHCAGAKGRVWQDKWRTESVVKKEWAGVRLRREARRFWDRFQRRRHGSYVEEERIPAVHAALFLSGKIGELEEGWGDWSSPARVREER